jgi:ferredoxin
LRGIDAYLLVANSRGVNVWCAATGGLLTNHDVISVLKTSGIGECVDHRQVILPQLAATGVECEVIHQKAGWQVIWGPVCANSIPEFLSGGLEKTAEMRTVTFRWPQRLEMAIAWAFPISLLSLVVWPFWTAGGLPLATFVWMGSLILVLGFPLCESWLRGTGKAVGFMFFTFGERGVPLLLWLLFVCGLVGYLAISGEFSWPPLLRWGLASFVALLILGIDISGSTPTYKGGLQEDRLLRIALDPELCQGVGTCEEVCPTNVIDVDREQSSAALVRREACVQCGACIVQCPLDALYFQGSGGEVVTPDAIRRFKLNMLGSRRRPVA